MIAFDTNVVVAALIEVHPHHGASRRAFQIVDPAEALLPAHCLAEAYAVLTRPRPYDLPSAIAWTALENLASSATTVQMSASQVIDAIRRFSALGTGPRLYDYLIGATGQAHGARTIVTWNVKDFAPLFPQLEIVAPDAFQPSPQL